MKTIRNITVATDFSITARNAYRYAKKLSSSMNCPLTVVNVLESSLINSDLSIDLFSDGKEINSINSIKEFIHDENSLSQKMIASEKVNIKTLEGDPVDALTEYSKTGDTDLLVIGTSGLSDVLTKIMGSISHNISNKAYCPVLLVPRNVKWSPIQRILYASNYDSMTSVSIEQLSDFALNLKSEIHFVNIRNFDPPFEVRQKEFNWDNLKESVNPVLFTENSIIYGNDTIEELKKYCMDKDIDLMVFVSKRRSFWESLVHKSITENMALSTSIPMMVIHTDDE